jgi:hypothetical protein
VLTPRRACAHAVLRRRSIAPRPATGMFIYVVLNVFIAIVEEAFFAASDGELGCSLLCGVSYSFVCSSIRLFAHLFRDARGHHSASERVPPGAPPTPPRGRWSRSPRRGGEFLLFTVTFYANLAHSLTRSP